MGCSNKLSDIWPDDLYFVVPASGSPYINPGGQIITLPEAFGKGGGWKVRVNRNNVPIDYEDQGTGDPYFTQNLTNNFINLSSDAVEGEKFLIMAYKPATA